MAIFVTISLMLTALALQGTQRAYAKARVQSQKQNGNNGRKAR